MNNLSGQETAMSGTGILFSLFNASECTSQAYQNLFPFPVRGKPICLQHTAFIIAKSNDGEVQK